MGRARMKIDRTSVDMATAIRTPPSVDTAVLGRPRGSVSTSAGFSVGDRARIWLDHLKLGSGDRYLILTAIGQHTVDLYSAAALVSVTIPRSEFERYAERYASDPSAVLAILKRNLDCYKRHHLEHDRCPEAVMWRLKEEAGPHYSHRPPPARRLVSLAQNSVLTVRAYLLIDILALTRSFQRSRGGFFSSSINARLTVDQLR